MVCVSVGDEDVSREIRTAIQTTAAVNNTSMMISTDSIPGGWHAESGSTSMRVIFWPVDNLLFTSSNNLAIFTPSSSQLHPRL